LAFHSGGRLPTGGYRSSIDPCSARVLDDLQAVQLRGERGNGSRATATEAGSHVSPPKLID